MKAQCQGYRSQRLARSCVGCSNATTEAAAMAAGVLVEEQAVVPGQEQGQGPRLGLGLGQEDAGAGQQRRKQA